MVSIEITIEKDGQTRVLTGELSLWVRGLIATLSEEQKEKMYEFVERNMEKHNAFVRNARNLI